MSISLSKAWRTSATLALVCSGAWVDAALAAAPTTVPTDAGTVQGLSTTDGRQFLGIPFAAPRWARCGGRRLNPPQRGAVCGPPRKPPMPASRTGPCRQPACPTPAKIAFT